MNHSFTKTTGIRLKKYLDPLCQQFPVAESIQKDPVQFPRRYFRSEDQEVVAFFASALAYGSVSQFIPKIEQILSQMGPKPADFLKTAPPKKLEQLCHSFDYRFTKAKDLTAFFKSTSLVLQHYGTLEALFQEGYSTKHSSYYEAMSHFIEQWRKTTSNSTRGFAHLVPDPTKKSSMKRFCLFLRWMIRKADAIDLGTWSQFPTDKLTIPLDTHISRIAYQLGLSTEEGGSTWKRAQEISQNLKKVDSLDPLKYDFYLAHLGIQGWCPKRQEEHLCRSCLLRAVCVRV